MGNRRLLLIFVLRGHGAAVSAEQIFLVENRPANRAFFENVAHGKILYLTDARSPQASFTTPFDSAARLRFRALYFWQSASSFLIIPILTEVPRGQGR